VEIQDANGQSSSPTENLSADPASLTGQDVTPQSSSGPDASSPSPKAEEPVSERDGLLAAVRDVVKIEEDNPDPADQLPPGPKQEAAQGEEGPKDPADPEAETPDVTPEELAACTPNARKRIEGLVKERNTLKEAVSGLQQDAEVFRTFQSYLQENNLANQEVNQLLMIGATLKRGDFQSFYQMVAPYFQAAAEATGQQLPADLQRQVDDGYVTPELAREIAVNRAQAETLRAQLGQRDQRAAEMARVNQTNSVRSSVAAWEAQVQATDPDYSLKAKLVQTFAKGIVAERGLPRNSDEALAWTKEAYGLATDQVKALRPSPQLQPTRPTPGGVHVPTAAKPEPRSLIEAIQQGLQQAAS
jgi:hypothetical protein